MPFFLGSIATPSPRRTSAPRYDFDRQFHSLLLIRKTRGRGRDRGRGIDRFLSRVTLGLGDTIKSRALGDTARIQRKSIRAIPSLLTMKHAFDHYVTSGMRVLPSIWTNEYVDRARSSLK